MTKGLTTRLFLPLTAVSILFVIMHCYWNADGFFLNLSTELIGIFITLYYVDWILKQHENQQWQGMDARVKDRLRILLNATTSGLRGALGFSDAILDMRVLATTDLKSVHKEVMRIAEHIIAPAALQRVRGLDEDGWRRLDQHIGHVHNALLAFLNAFQARLTPEQLCGLLDLQESLSKSLTYYQTFPEIAGAPKDRLPNTRTPPEELQQHGCESTAREIREICRLVKQISESIDR